MSSPVLHAVHERGRRGAWLLGAIGLVALVGVYGISAESYLALAAAAVLMLVALLALAWQAGAPLHGLALLLVSAVAAPVSVTEGLNVPFVLTAFLCAAWLVQSVAFRRRLALDRSRVVTAALAFCAVAAIAFLVGQYPWFPVEPAPMRAQVGGLGLFLLSAGLLLLVGHQITRMGQLERLTRWFIGAGAVVVATQVLPLFGLAPYVDRVTRPDTIGSMFWVWLVALSVSQGLFNRNLSPGARVVFVGIGVVAVARGLFLAFSWASGWLPPLIALGILCLLRFPRTTLGAGLLLAAPVVALSGPIVDALMGGESYSWLTRIQAFEVIGQIIQRNPLLGFGPANYYHYTLLFPILGWWVRFNSHNTYVDLVAQTGLVGLVIFLWLAVEVGALALRLRGRLPIGFARAYVAGAFAGLVASMVAAWLADWIVPFTYNVGIRGFRSSLLFWFFLGGVLAIRRLTTPAGRSAGGHGLRWEGGP